MNIAFRIELERILVGVTRCVLPNHPFPIKDFVGLVPIDPELAKSLAEKAIRDHPDHKELENMGLSAMAFPILLSRVLKLTFAPDIQVFVCDIDWKDELEKRLERMKKIEAAALRERDERKWTKLVRTEGKILGYPECCIEKFVRGKLKSDPPETRLIARCIDEGLLDKIYSLLRNPTHPDEDLFIFFTSNFYPCDLKCKKALRIGVTVRDSLGGKLKRVYELKVILNSANVLMSAYGTYRFVKLRGIRTEFGRLVEEFFEGKDIGFMDSVFELYSSNPLKFEEEFISMHLD